jgi:hypothetical protein
MPGRMSADGEAFELLQREFETLRADWHAAGIGDEFEDVVDRFKADGIWPFRE